MLGGTLACADAQKPAATPPPVVREAPPVEAGSVLAALVAVDPAERDQVDLARRYKGVDPMEEVAHPSTAVGETALFWYKEQENDNNRQTLARLLYSSDQLNMWVEDGVKVDDAAVQQAARELESRIFPTTRALFGQERQPGIDGDARLNILHIGSMGGQTIGYFSAADAFSTEVNPFSNSRDMFYINLDFVEIGDADYFEVVAHEFQHMIHWNIDRNETSWLNEGFAELSAALNGFGDSDHLVTFLEDGDTPLTYFDYEGGDYGAAYLFAVYLHQRLGAAFIKDLVAEKRNGAAGIDALLARQGSLLTFEQLFADWVVANLAGGRGWSRDDTAMPAAYPTVGFPRDMRTHTLRPGETAAEGVSQFGTDYWQIDGRLPQTVIFTGTRQIPLLAARPAGGAFMWTTVPADGSDMQLTREFDLSGVPTATLRFKTWYEIELGWDYAYVSVSADQGRRWQPLQTIATSGADPHGNNLGQGFTGTSGSGDEPRWIEQTADLSPFAGDGKLWLRFEFVSDDARHFQGFALDDIEIPEIGFFDDAETADAGWQADGFVRHGNILPQDFLVQQILIDSEGDLTASRLPLTADNRGRWTIPLDQNHSRAILAVSAVTPVTFQTAGYEITHADQ